MFVLNRSVGRSVGLAHRQTDIDNQLLLLLPMHLHIHTARQWQVMTQLIVFKTSVFIQILICCCYCLFGIILLVALERLIFRFCHLFMFISHKVFHEHSVKNSMLTEQHTHKSIATTNEMINSNRYIHIPSSQTQTNIQFSYVFLLFFILCSF